MKEIINNLGPYFCFAVFLMYAFRQFYWLSIYFIKDKSNDKKSLDKTYDSTSWLLLLLSPIAFVVGMLLTLLINAIFEL